MPGFPKKQAQIIALADQPKKNQLEYRVIAINKAGDGPPSNTALVVL